MNNQLSFLRSISNFIGYCIVFSIAIMSSHAQVTTAPLKDSLSGDTNGNMVANPGDTLTYKTTLTNEGANDALNVMFNLMLDPNTTLVPGSIKTTSLALNDTFDVDCAGLNIAAPGLLTNDFDDNIPGLSVVWNSSPSALGQMVSVNSDGSFMYPMTEDIMENDSFRYAITDVDGNTDTALVFLRINSVDNLIFVDNNNMSAGDGTSTNPYNSLALAEMNSNPGDTIFVFEGSGPYADGIILQNNQALIGEQEGLNSQCINIPAGNAPTIENATGDGIILAQNNIIKGIKIGNASGFAIDDAGSSVGSLVIASTEICNSSGGGFRTINGGILNVSMEALSSNGGSNGIITNNMIGSFSVMGMTTIDNSTAAGFQTQNNTVNFTFNNLAIDNSTSNSSGIIASGGGSLDVTFGMVNSGSGIPIDIDGMSTGGFSLSSVMSTGNTLKGVELTNNSGTWNLGTVAVTRTSGVAFFASNAGTVNSTNGTISTTTGRAVDIDNTILGTTFTSVSCIGCPTGIDLNNTTGSFNVIGNGSTAGSGGIIQNTTSNGIRLISSSSIVLAYIDLNRCQGNGIFGTDVENFELSNSTLIGNGNDLDEGGIRFADTNTTTPSLNGLAGTAKFENILIDNLVPGNFGENHVEIINISKSLNLVVSASIFQNTNNSTMIGADAFLLETRGASMANLTFTGNTFSNNFTDGIQLVAIESSSIIARIGQNGTGNENNFSMNERAVNLSNAFNADIFFEIINNDVNNCGGNSLNIVSITTTTSNAELKGSIDNNTIGTSGVANSGSASGHGIQLDLRGDVDSHLSVSGNTINETNLRGINYDARLGAGDLEVEIINNTIDGAFDGIEIRTRNGHDLCTKISGNQVTNVTGNDAYHLRESNPTHNVETNQMNATMQVTNNNTGSPVTVEAGVGIVAPGTCDLSDTDL